MLLRSRPAWIVLPSPIRPARPRHEAALLAPRRVSCALCCQWLHDHQGIGHGAHRRRAVIDIRAHGSALDKVDLAPIAHAKVFVDTQYLDCVDKNYVIVALHQRLLQQGCSLVEKRDDADVVVEVGSGGLGTDRTEWFVGTPAIPLPLPSPIGIPKMALFTRTRAIGTAKLSVIAMDVKSHQAVINSGCSLRAQRSKELEHAGHGLGANRQRAAGNRHRHGEHRVRVGPLERCPTNIANDGSVANGSRWGVVSRRSAAISFLVAGGELPAKASSKSLSPEGRG